MENKSEEKIEEKIQLIQIEDEPKVEEHYKLYGLQVNRKETNRLQLQNENEFSLIIATIEACDQLVNNILAEVKQQRQFKISFNSILYQETTLLKSGIHRLKASLVHLLKLIISRRLHQKSSVNSKKSLDKEKTEVALDNETEILARAKQLGEESRHDYETIENFSFEYRGILLTIVHHLHDMLDLFETQQLKRNSNIYKKLKITQFQVESHFESRIVTMNRKLVALQTIVAACCLMAKAKEKRKGIFPFCKLNESKMKGFENVKVIDFYKDMGPQYYPKARNFLRLLVKVTAALSATLKLTKNHIGKQILFSWFFLWYLGRLSSSAVETSKFLRTVTLDQIKELWNLPELGYIKPLYAMSYPPIHTSVVFEIPSWCKPTVGKKIEKKTKDEKDREEKEDKGEKEKKVEKEEKKKEEKKEPKKEPETKEKEDKKSKQEVPQKKATDKDLKTQPDKEDIKKEEKDTTPIKTTPDRAYVTLQEFNSFYDKLSPAVSSYNKPTIQLALISPFQMNLYLNTVTSHPFINYIKNTWAVKFSRKTAPSETESTSGCLILHIHGGGFVSMTPFGHENYLRKWCTETSLPIISVNYSKAPEYTFPVAVEECYQVYKWILKHGDDLLSYPLTKIILAGDSAGACLCMGVLMKAIHDNIQLPTALALTYPAAYLQHRHSPSRALSLIDPMVNHKFLKTVTRAYAGSDDPEDNPFLSPSLAPPEILKKFPPVYISIGTLDPLFDDAWYLAKRINKYNGGKVKFEMWDSLGHGFLSITNFVPEAQIATIRVAKWINDILDLDEE